MSDPAPILKRPPVLTGHLGDSDVSFRAIAKLYIRPTDLVVDLTYGYGRFWRRVEAMPRVVRMDLDWRHPHKRMDVVANFREPLPFRAGVANVVVYDPDFKFGSRHDMNDDQDGYGNNGRPVEERGRVAVWRRYGITLEERMYPLLKPGGLAILKGQDGVEGGRNHLFLHMPALLPTPDWRERWELLDVFVSVRKTDPRMRHSYQFHARKNHSYFVVLRKRPPKPIRLTTTPLF